MQIHLGYDSLFLWSIYSPCPLVGFNANSLIRKNTDVPTLYHLPHFSTPCSIDFNRPGQS